MVASDKRAAISCLIIQTAPILMGLGIACSVRRTEKVRFILALSAALGVANALQSFNQVAYLNKALIEQYRQDPNGLLVPLGIEPDTVEAFLFEHRLLTSVGSGFLTTRNSAGLFELICLCAIGSLWGLARTRHAADSRQDVVFAICGLAILAGLALARAKNAVAALWLAGMLLGLKAKHRPVRIASYLGLACVSILAITAIAIGALGRSYRLPQPLMVRWQYWTATIQIIKDHPWFGVGPCNFAYQYCRYKLPEAIETISDPHNLVLSLLAQYGPIGLIGWAVMVLGPCAWALRSRPIDLESPPVRQPSTWTTSMLCMIALAMFVIRPVLLGFLQDPIAADQQGGLFVETILPGLLVVIFTALMVLVASRHVIDTVRLGTGLLLVLGLLATIINGLVDFAPFEPANATWFWALAGCILGLYRPKGQPQAPARLLSALGIAGMASVVIWVFFIGPPTIASMLVLRAYKATQQADRQTAAACLDRAIDADPLWPAAASLRASMVLQAEQADEQELQRAISCLRIAIRRNPADYRHHQRLAEALARLGDYAQAYKAMEQAVALYPGSERLWFQLGQLAEAVNMPKEALAYYKKVVMLEQRFEQEFKTLYPHWPRPVSRLGQARYKQALQRIASLSARSDL
jgi:tetratricopeptide (TPR) repeat protein